MKKLTIRTKITLWFSVAMFLIVALTYIVILSVSNQVIQKTIRDGLIETVAANVDEIEYFGSIDELNNSNDVDYYVYYGDGLLEIDDDFLDSVNQIYTSLCLEDGTLFYGENPIARETAEMDFINEQVQTLEVEGTLYYVYDIQLTIEGLEGLWLRGVVSEEQGNVEMSSISRMSLILLPSIMLLAIIGGYLTARRMLRPIKQITDGAAKIRQGNDLKERIEVGEGKDELHELADQFNQMFARLDDSFAAQQQFVSDSSHELRTPVSVINAQCELTLEQDRSTEEYKEALQVIRRQGRKMDRLVNDMLEFTRLETQPERYPKEELDLTGLVENLCYDMALIGEKGIELSCEAVPGVRYNGNYELLTRMLSNLITNAYRYGNENGHIRVRLNTADETSARDAHHIILSVQDDGIGIAEEEHEHIFRRFYQSDSSRSGAGSGLGLAMVSEIVRFHDGEIKVESRPGEGSTFTVYL